MSWFSDEHKKLYSQALGALYEDVKSGSGILIDTSSKLLSTGYEKIKESVTYLDKKYNTSDLSDDNNVSDNMNDENINRTDEQSMSEFDMSEDTDEYLITVGRNYPDILIKLHKKLTHIIRIWIIDKDGTHKPVRGKIESYSYISEIIHKSYSYVFIHSCDIVSIRF